MDKRQKMVVVSGGGEGLGLELAKIHLESGDRVFAWSRNRYPQAEQAQRAHAGFTYFQCDIGEAAQVKDVCAQVLGQAGHVDMVYNVAAIHPPNDNVDLAGTNLEDCLEAFNVNTVGALRVTQALLGGLGEGSVVVMVSSEAGSIGQSKRQKEYAYCMSKAALNMGSKLLANQMTELGVRVLAVHPGWVRTRMGGQQAHLSPGESAGDVAALALAAIKNPPEHLFVDHAATPLPW